MKTFLFCPRVAISATVLMFLLVYSNKNFAQDSQLSQDFKKGVIASSISGAGGYQSATLSWSGISYPAEGASVAGYLIIYSTSTPTLISSPNGSAPANTVLNGTVVATTSTSLPTQPATVATATGLTNGTTYNFMIIAYFWDGINKSTYTYSSPAKICLTVPPDKPDNINLSSASISAGFISGSFTQPLIAPDGYVITYSIDAIAPTLKDGILYQAGDVVAGDTVVQVGNSTSFNITSGSQLSATTNYYVHVHSYVLSGCSNKPVYSLDYLSNSINVLPGKIQDTTSNEVLIEAIDIEPNPVETNSWLKIATLKSDNNVSIIILTVDGRTVAQKGIQVQSGVNRTNLHAENLSRGMYILRVIFSNGITKAMPFIKK